MTQTTDTAEGEAVGKLSETLHQCFRNLLRNKTVNDREYGILETLLSNIDNGYATLARQLAEALRQRDDYAEMWESNAMATAAAANHALKAEEALAEAQGVIERLTDALKEISTFERTEGFDAAASFHNVQAFAARTVARAALTSPAPPREQHSDAVRQSEEP